MYCKGQCKPHYQAAYAKANPEVRRRAGKAYDDRNREELNAKSRARYAANVEAERARSRAKYARDPETAKARSIKAMKENVESTRAAGRKSARKRNAIKAGFAQPNVDHLQPLPCAQCGAEGPSHIDHIVPLSWCADMPEAVACCEDPACYQPLCQSCNSSKYNRGVWAFVPTGTIG